MKILPSRFLSVVNKYVNFGYAHFSVVAYRIVAVQHPLESCILALILIVCIFGHFFVPLLHSFVVTMSSNRARYHFQRATHQGLQKSIKIRNKLKRYRKWKLMMTKLSYCCLMSKTFVRCSRALKTLRCIMVRDNVVRFNFISRVSMNAKITAWLRYNSKLFFSRRDC